MTLGAVARRQAVDKMVGRHCRPTTNERKERIKILNVAAGVSALSTSTQVYTNA